MFSSDLKRSADPILRSIYQHPFIQDIANGHVKKEAIQFYVEQDHQYLNEFARIYAHAITQTPSEDLDIMRFLNQNIDFILNSESEAHLILCNAAGFKYDDLKQATPSPKAYMYESHMFRAVDTGSLLNILCALLACPWTYNEIGKHLTKKGPANNDNPFHQWIEFYADDKYDDNHSMTETLTGFIDRLAQNASDEDKITAKKFFLTSCELEWQFWEQAYYQQDWKFKDIIENN